MSMLYTCAELQAHLESQHRLHVSVGPAVGVATGKGGGKLTQLVRTAVQTVKAAKAGKQSATDADLILDFFPDEPIKGINYQQPDGTSAHAQWVYMANLLVPGGLSTPKELEAPNARALLRLAHGCLLAVESPSSSWVSAMQSQVRESLGKVDALPANAYALLCIRDSKNQLITASSANPNAAGDRVFTTIGDVKKEGKSGPKEPGHELHLALAIMDFISSWPKFLDALVKYSDHHPKYPGLVSGRLMGGMCSMSKSWLGTYKAASELIQMDQNDFHGNMQAMWWMWTKSGEASLDFFNRWCALDKIEEEVGGVKVLLPKFEKGKADDYQVNREMGMHVVRLQGYMEGAVSWGQKLVSLGLSDSEYLTSNTPLMEEAINVLRRIDKVYSNTSGLPFGAPVVKPDVISRFESFWLRIHMRGSVDPDGSSGENGPAENKKIRL